MKWRRGRDLNSCVTKWRRRVTTELQASIEDFINKLIDNCRNLDWSDYGSVLSMTPRSMRYLIISAAILLLVASIAYLLMFGTVLLLIVAASASTTFSYYPEAIPFILGIPGIFLFYGFIQILWWRANPAEHRIFFFAIGLISLIIGVQYFLFPIGPWGPPPHINPNAPGPIIMYSLPIIAGIITIIAPLLKEQS